jgi:hypothetical protein
MLGPFTYYMALQLQEERLRKADRRRTTRPSRLGGR